MTVIGSLFSGYEGLGLAIDDVIGGERAWVSDIDEGANAILAHRFPDVPNLGDIGAINWSTVRPVDVLTGGFPCTDVSLAGLRLGMYSTTRSGLWSMMAGAVDALRPSLVVIENVRGLLSADAHSNMERCAWCLGDAAGEPTLRALGAVLADLADIGYDAAWYGVTAASIGAPHERFRVFVTAWPTGDTPGVIGERGRRLRTEPSRPAWAGRRTDRSTTQDTDVAASGERWESTPGKAEGRRSRSDPGGRSGISTDADGAGLQRAQPAAGRDVPHGRVTADTVGSGRDGRSPEPVRGAVVGATTPGRRPGAVTDAQGDGRTERRGHPDSDDGQASVGGTREPTGGDPREWGPYGPAVRRWATVLGRPAPAPTEASLKGNQRLSPRFVEWMMGLPDGWVTDVPRLTRSQQLKALGNGVVPQQAAEALRVLLPVSGYERTPAPTDVGTGVR